MSFDNSRIIFNSWKDYLGMISQQGRVQLDSDWNDFQAEYLRRTQVGMLDAIGELPYQAMYPAALPNSFLITPQTSATGTSQILIGAGRIYVDGLLAENHGPMGADAAPTSIAQWDAVLAELSNTYPGAGFVGVDYLAQPYYPNPPAIGAGPYLVYLDVWQRAITYLQDPDLVDVAVGVDTTGRLQTVWQVRLLDVSGATSPVQCSTPKASIPGWTGATQPSGGQLTTKPVSTTPSGPCVLTPTTGYTGQENQFYRVQIHQGGDFGTATFKWSRDNGSVMTGVLGINNGAKNTAGKPATLLSVQSLGRDQVLGFNKGDWIEIIDDDLELNGQAGELHLIDSVSPSAKTITLVDTLANTGDFPLTGGLTDPTRHTRIILWSQQGTIYQSDFTTVVATLGQASVGGDIPLSGPNIQIVLENGVTAAFSLDPSLGKFQVGDFWTFAARTFDGSVELLRQAPPRGIHHHYAALAVVSDFTSTPPDCRVQWPPAQANGGSCGCTVVIGPGDVTANNTLQQIVDQFKGSGTQSVICLQPGAYMLYAPLQLTAAHTNIVLQACQQGAAVLQIETGAEALFTNGMVVLDGVDTFAFDGLAFDIPRVPFSATTFAGQAVASLSPDIASGVQSLDLSIGLRPINCDGITINACTFRVRPIVRPRIDVKKGPGGGVGINQGPATTPFGAAIFASGNNSDFTITGNTFEGGASFAGLLAAPVVTFGVPPPPPAPAPAAQQIAAAAKAKVTKVKAAKLQALTVESNVSEFGTEASAAASGQLAGDALLNPNSVLKIPIDFPPWKFGNVNNTVTLGLASQGGTVLAAVVDNLVFENNLLSSLTIGVLIVGEADAVSLTGNTLTGCTAGCWLLAPSTAAILAMDAQNVAGLGLFLAMGLPLPVADAGPVTVQTSPATVYTYTGAKALRDDTGALWLPDISTPSLAVSGGFLNQPNPPHAIEDASPDQSADFLYQNERWNVFTYTFAVPTNGFYQVTLKFSEITYAAAGSRVFDVTINGNTVLQDFDVYADANGEWNADDKIFSNVVPVNGQIVISFVKGEADWPKISAVEIEPQWDGTLPNPYFSTLDSENTSFYTGELENYFCQMTQLAQQGYADSGAPLESLSLRVEANEMSGLTSVGLLILWDDLPQTGQVSSAVVTGNRILTSNYLQNYRELWREGACLLFFGAAVVSLVSRCSVTGNVVINDGQTFSVDLEYGLGGRLSMVVDADGTTYAFTPRSMGTAVPSKALVSVVGNVCQGQLEVSPSTSSILFQMNGISG
ncbi:MAG TPA: DUF6519 domain-containing protein [Opitutaceae bacterium]|jgi:hypothetical protein